MTFSIVVSCDKVFTCDDFFWNIDIHCFQSVGFHSELDERLFASVIRNNKEWIRLPTWIISVINLVWRVGPVARVGTHFWNVPSELVGFQNNSRNLSDFVLAACEYWQLWSKGELDHLYFRVLFIWLFKTSILITLFANFLISNNFFSCWLSRFDIECAFTWNWFSKWQE